MTISREDRLRIMPSSMRATYQKGLTSRSAAVKAMCQECTGYDRQTVKLCPSVACPLHPWRPYQGGDEDEEVQDAP